ncbi:MAG: DUF4411 family protein [Planctomycetota bacterium]
MKYCIDTSSLMDAWRRWYPPDLFPSLWAKLDELVSNGDLISSEEVLRELERKEDGLLAWANEHSGMFLPLSDEIQEITQQILDGFPKLVDSRTGKSFADPFVIATARATGTTVVTGERLEGSVSRPKIPSVCNELGIPWIGTVQLISSEGWKF